MTLVKKTLKAVTTESLIGFPQATEKLNKSRLTFVPCRKCKHFTQNTDVEVHTMSVPVINNAFLIQLNTKKSVYSSGNI